MFTFHCHPVFHYPFPLHAALHPFFRPTHPQVCPHVWNPSQSGTHPICPTHSVAHYHGKLCPKHAHLANTYASRALPTPAQELHHQVVKANDQLEHFMEDAEMLFGQLDKYPELQQMAKQLTKAAAQMRKQEPMLDKEGVQTYEKAVKAFEQESREKLAKVKEQFVAYKKAQAGKMEIPAKPETANSIPTASKTAQHADTSLPNATEGSNPDIALATPFADRTEFMPDKTAAEHTKAQADIERAEQSLIEAFQAIKEGTSYSYADLLASRQAFWSRHKKKINTEDLAAFQRKTEKHASIDRDLTALIQKNPNCKNHLDLAYAIKDDRASHTHYKHIIKALQDAERHAASSFLKDIYKTAKLFEKNGYQSVAEHYYATLDEFVRLLDRNPYFEGGLSEYIHEWTQKENELTSEKEYFQALHETEEALAEFRQDPRSERVQAQIEALNARKADLKGSLDIEYFIQDAQRLMQ